MPRRFVCGRGWPETRDQPRANGCSDRKVWMLNALRTATRCRRKAGRVSIGVETKSPMGQDGNFEQKRVWGDLPRIPTTATARDCRRRNDYADDVAGRRIRLGQPAHRERQIMIQKSEHVLTKVYSAETAAADVPAGTLTAE